MLSAIYEPLTNEFHPQQKVHLSPAGSEPVECIEVCLPVGADYVYNK